MNIKTLALAATLCATTGIAQAAIYKCSIRGETKYQDHPCADAPSQRVVLKADQPASPKDDVPKTVNDVMGYFGEDGYDFYRSLFESKSKIVAADSSSQAHNCMETWRHAFKDPKSVYLVSSVMRTRGEETFVEADVAARNGFGGFGRDALLCDVKSAAAK